MNNRFYGVYPILYAFFGADGALDREAMRRQTKWCLQQGAHGMAALGLATEVEKLTPGERRSIMEWLIEDVAGKAPVAITVFGETPSEQIDFVRAAAQAGAAWVILQPPRSPLPDEASLVHFFGKVMDASPLPVAIQNAPLYLRNSLGHDSLAVLSRRHANFTLLKGESSALAVKEISERTEGRLLIFNGRGGLEMPDCLRAGCIGIIPAPDCSGVLCKIFTCMREGEEQGAEELYANVLPLITFIMQSIDQLICYGKRLVARRLDLGPVFDREPCQKPTGFGLSCLDRYAANLPR